MSNPSRRNAGAYSNDAMLRSVSHATAPAFLPQRKTFAAVTLPDRTLPLSGLPIPGRSGGPVCPKPLCAVCRKAARSSMGLILVQGAGYSGDPVSRVCEGGV